MNTVTVYLYNLPVNPLKRVKIDFAQMSTLNPLRCPKWGSEFSAQMSVALSLKLYPSIFFNHFIFFFSSFFSLLHYLFFTPSNLPYGVIYWNHGKLSYPSILLIIFVSQCLLHLFIMFISSFLSPPHLLHLFIFLKVLHKHLLFLGFK